MSIKISDYISVGLRSITRGNITEKRALSLADKIKSVGNTPKFIYRALEKKHSKHPELNLNIAMSYKSFKSAENILSAGIKVEAERVGEHEEIIHNYGAKVKSQAKKILHSNNFVALRIAIYLKLYEKYGIDLSINSRLKVDLLNLRCKVNNLQAKLNNFEKLKDKYIVKYGGEYGNWKAKNEFGKQEKSLHSDITGLNKQITTIGKKIIENTKIITEVIISVSKENINKLSPEAKDIIKEHDKLVSDYKSAPNIIEKTKANIEKLQSVKDWTSDRSGELEHLMDMLAVTEVIKEANVALMHQQNVNDRLASNIESTMKQQLEVKAKTDSVLSGKVDKALTVGKPETRPAATSTEKLVYPEMPQNNTERVNNPTREKRLMQHS